MTAAAHIVWFILSVLFPPLIILWIISALCCGSSKRNKMIDLQKENNELLRKLNERNWK